MTIATSPRIRGVIFDLDGTLYAMRWYLQPVFFVTVFPHGMRLVRVWRMRGKYAGEEMVSQGRLADAISEDLARTETVSAAEARLWIDHAFYDSYVAIMRFFRGSRPGLNSLLAAVRAKGIKLAVLSDYGRVAERLEKLGIPPDLFDTVASCEACGALKPHPRPFLEIAKEWAISPHQVLVVGDRADTDGEAARGAGMDFLRIRASAAAEGARWRVVRKTLEALPAAVQ